MILWPFDYLHVNIMTISLWKEQTKVNEYTQNRKCLNFLFEHTRINKNVCFRLISLMSNISMLQQDLFQCYVYFVEVTLSLYLWHLSTLAVSISIQFARYHDVGLCISKKCYTTWKFRVKLEEIASAETGLLTN